MGTAALSLALAAAVVHATWNLLLADSDDTHATTAVGVAVGALAFAPVAALSWHVSRAALPYIVASSALELTYLALLASAYSIADLSFVYPIARGSAPVLVLLVSVAFLGAALSWAAAAGVLLVAGGIVLVRGLGRAARGRDLALALAIGALIAAYTLIDNEGVTHASALAYLEVTFALLATVYVAAAWRLRGPAAIRAALTLRSAIIGLGYFGAYGLTLLALQRAAAAPVAAVRETSVLIATAVAARALREPVGARRLLGAIAVVAGVAAIALA